ncbi:amidohydrolase family protein [Aquimarina sp. 2201CG5-10]|uniref:amidohydrolase family protein n=1 Tax=Aquimarina callyspongiae TaxID=3098150 RepID=UPI002AB4AFFA|nr:amidohydrolase family protein [Aquimarina sp. 2201CG5-10]MDY8135986.1 amidohydrolase family protein [Aquimarina sp. 2201CG5-10]
MKLIHGNWFNGEIFENKTVWIKDGLIYFKNINHPIDTIINLSGKYIIPPFADAHNHNLESSYELDKRIHSYLDNGVFYVKHLSSIKKRIAPLMFNYNKPDGIDVSLAHAPLTASGGHPIALRKRHLSYGYFDGLFNSIEEIEFHGYVRIDNKKDLENKWDTILSFSPDFIKINLLYSEEYNKRKNDTSYFGKKGLNPKLVPLIVNKAHAEGLRVSAHVETAYDFYIAVNAGVDEIAHLPEIKNGKPIDKVDVLLAKEKGIVVVTTVSLVTKRRKASNYNDLVNNISLNLKLLKDHGVTIALGSDMYNDNSTGEFEILQQLNVFSNLELLKMWTENAPKTIFPNRKIGALKESYEASFLVLDKNPIKDISNINNHIAIRVKQGVVLK